MGEITYLNKATTKNESLRTTVPRSIVQQFGLTEYDKLEWILKAEGSELIIEVKPQKGEVR
ncbi:MAG: AbrB family transcriptional regulator [Candidatus Bathyarchaeia archaeon]|jgi:bifunctional DNA-binding transcriptional regulator/antitoxin component of YhaV-PrlF toxin-antitoxin module